jgi:chlorobactene glucosyltransferase
MVCVGWLIARAFSQRGLLPALKAVPAPPAETAPDVTVIIPTRDEEDNIGPCLRALLRQSYPPSRFRILVVDDHSTDATVDLAKSIAPGIEVVRSPPLPPRWIGKSHACWFGAHLAVSDAQWLCFLDADVKAEPALLAGAVAAATRQKLDLLSLAPRQELGSFAERLVMPCGLFLLAFRQDLRQVQSRDCDDAAATGQFMLFRAEAYRRIGGHAAVKGAICEDLELARLLKRSGGSVLMHDGRQLLSARMYTGWRTLWPGFAKNLVEMLGGPVSSVSIALVGIMLAWAAVLVPLADAIGCARGSTAGCVALAPGLAASAAAFGLHIAGTIYFGIPFWYGLLFPLGYTAGAMVAIDSVRWRLRHRVSWKGRSYP